MRSTNKEENGVPMYQPNLELELDSASLTLFAHGIICRAKLVPSEYKTIPLFVCMIRHIHCCIVFASPIVLL